jgi:subfamily B ATP-binding cassette protein HlyB/CyaB
VLRLAQLWQDFHQARLSVARLGDILNTTAEPTYTAARARLPAIRGNIKFDHVTFRYRIDGQEVLHDVTFDVPAGQTVGIVGPSGSGKSTFAKLVQRLYVPESGRVLVDGMDLAMADPAWLRRQIGVVLQENVLFNRSVPCPWIASSRRQASREPTNSSSSWPKATIRSSASAAQPSPVASASASLSPARSSPTLAF